MKRTYIDYIEDILTSIQEIEEFVKGMSFDDFVKDKKTVNAVIRSLEVMGEAVKKIPKEIRDRNSQYIYPQLTSHYRNSNLKIT